MSIRDIFGRGLLVVALAGLVSVASCDFLDPTQVENPRTTDDDLADAEEPTAALLPGMRAQFARMVESTVILTEVISDNYSIHGTGLNKAYDNPALLRPATLNSTSRTTGAYWNSQELRALGDFVIDEIAANDATATAEQVQEAQYYRGMALLNLGENFVAAPVTGDAAPLSGAELLDLAETDLMAAAAAASWVGTAASAALARLYRLEGDAANASSYASQALADDASFVYGPEYDQSSIDNTVYWYVVWRALREMQPLPRLDFLDPKYLDWESMIPAAKAEEMLLIMAEAEFANGTWAQGREYIAQAVELALTRTPSTFNDDDLRQNLDGSIRPRTSTIQVRADASSEYRSGLVLDRPGSISAPTVSMTSLNADSIRNSLTTEEESLHALYLARQEILFLEGRRMSDLGIRLPMMLREIERNTSITEGVTTGTEIVVPTYLPPNLEMDEYSPTAIYPAGEPTDPLVPTVTQVTISWDVNRILAQNRISPFNL